MNRFHVFELYLLFLLIINVRDILTESECADKVKVLYPRLVFAGPKERTFIKCSVCGIEFKKDDSNVYWLKKQRDGTKEEILHIDGKHTSWTSSGALHISDLRMEDTGFYICKKGDDIQGQYDLVVLPGANRTNVFVSLGEQPTRNTIDEEGTTLMYTEWSDWSECNRCGELGERSRQGWCRTNLYKEHIPKGAQCLYVAKFDTRLRFEERKKYAGRQDEVLYEECYIKKCPLTDIGFESLRGSLLNQININTLLDLPESRILITKQVGESVELICPGLRSHKILLSWRKGVMAISNTAMRRAARLNRTRVDLISTLYLRDLTAEDSDLYSCWENYKLKAVFKLFVVAKPSGRGWISESGKIVLYVMSCLFIALLVLVIIGFIMGVYNIIYNN